MSNQCEQLKQEYDNIKSLKQEFDLEYGKAVETGNTVRVKELKKELEEKIKDFKDKVDKLWTPHMITLSTKVIVKELNLTDDWIDWAEMEHKGVLICHKLVKRDDRGVIIEDKTDQLIQLLTHPKNRIKSIDLGGNKLGPEGAKHIADALKDPNNKVESINLAVNNLGPEGAKHIADALKHPNNKVESIDLWYNNLGLGDISAIKTIVEELKTKGRTIKLGIN
jgi:hypothetical protein